MYAKMMLIEQQLIAVRRDVIELCEHKHSLMFKNNDILKETNENMQQRLKTFDENKTPAFTYR
jgi:regulator of replication initiation timing